MIIQYYISNGEEINYSTQTDYLTLQDINEIASLYVKKKPETLPDTIFINVRFLSAVLFKLNELYTASIITKHVYIYLCWTIIDKDSSNDAGWKDASDR